MHNLLTEKNEIQNNISFFWEKRKVGKQIGVHTGCLWVAALWDGFYSLLVLTVFYTMSIYYFHNKKQNNISWEKEWKSGGKEAGKTVICP